MTTELVTLDEVLKRTFNEGFKAGAEAMRESIERSFSRAEGGVIAMGHAAAIVRSLPVPEVGK